MKELLKPLKNKILFILLIFIGLIVEVYCDLTLPNYTADIVDIGIQNTDFNVIYSTGFMMMLMVTLSIIATVIVSYFSSTVSSSYARDLREIVFEKVLKFSNNELNEISRSSLITRTTNDINQLQNVMGMLFRTILFAPLLGIGGIIKAFEIGTDLSWIIFVTFIAVAILLIAVMIRVMPYFKITQEIIDKINKTSREILIGMGVIKAFQRQDYEQERFEKTNKEFLDVNLYVYKTIMLLMPAMTIVLNLMIVLILYFGAFDALDGSLLTGEIIAFIQYSTQIVSAFLMMGGLIVMLPRVFVSARRVEEILKTKLSITNGEITEINDNPILEFKNVDYIYPEAKNKTLKNISFKLKPQMTTAIIGGTGSGKSTILNLILRFNDASSGEILIDNINIKNLNLKTLRDKISFTPQKALLFSGSVRTNLEIGKNNATESEMLNALSIAEVDFVDSVDDEVTQGGLNFSGGQRQRLSIARGVIKKHDFYLFDDCFSALDMKTEAKIKSRLNDLKKDSSILIVSQRISTIRDADEIIVLDKGEIVDKGSHDELEKRCRIYKEIVLSQKSSEVIG